MQYFLPRRKTLSSYFQPLNVEVPEGGDPCWQGFEFNPLAPMQALELTRVMNQDTVFWGITGQFTGGSAQTGVFMLITLIHNGVAIPLANKPMPLQNLCGSGANQFPIKPTLFVPAGDSIMVQVFSQDRTNNLNVEIVLFGNKVPAGWQNPATLTPKSGLSGLGRTSSSTSSVNPYQQMVLSGKSAQLDSLQPPNIDVAGDEAPVGAAPLVLTSSQQFPYPVPGAGPVTIFSYQVPPGQRVRIFEHALVNLGGGIVDMTGNVIWRFLVNGAPLKGLGAQLSQIGTFSTPDRVVIWLTENDLFQVTVESPNGVPQQAGNTAYRINGWTAPLLSQGTAS